MPSCLRRIKGGGIGGVIATRCRRIKVIGLLSVPNLPYTHTHAHLLHPPSLSPMVQPSHRVHVSWQRLSDPGPQEEKRGERIMASLILISLKKKKKESLCGCFFFCFFFVSLMSPLLSPPFAEQIIEKRRRDRINHSLSELRRLVPSAFEKQVSIQRQKGHCLKEN